MTAGALDRVSERAMLDLLHRRFGQRSYNGGVEAPRYVCAEHVRARSGFYARELDFVAVETWESSMKLGWLIVHGVEVKVSRSDWLRELKDPDKTAQTMECATHRWLAVPDLAIVRDGELPDGWGLLTPRGSRGLVAKVRPRLQVAERLGPSQTAALLRAVAKTSAVLTQQQRDRLTGDIRCRTGQLVTALSDDVHHIGYPGGLVACHCGLMLSGGDASGAFIDHVLALRKETNDA